MAKVLEFPSRQVQGLSYVESQLRELLKRKGADQALMDYAAITIREIYQHYANAENYSFRLELPEATDEAMSKLLQARIEDGIEGIRAENHAIIVRLIAELALARVQLYQRERD